MDSPLLQKYGRPPDTRADSLLLRRLRERFEPRAVVVVEARHAGELLAFSLFAHVGNTLIAVYTGARYDDPRSRLTHFATHFYEPARLAPTLGVERVSYGLGSWQAKRQRGATLTPLSAAGKLITAQRAA